MNTKIHWRNLLSRPSLLTGLTILIIIGISSLSAHWLTGADPMEIIATPNTWPFTDPEYPLGSDLLGRDILTGVLHGGRYSLSIGIQAGIYAAAFGLLIGCISGYFGGWIDHTLMRFTELFQVMPALIFTIIMVVILAPSVETIIIGIACTSWPKVARLVRSETARLRHADFVLAAQLLGMTDLRIIATHVIPNVLSSVLVTISILTGNAILIEAALSFLGLGDPNIMSWGSMIGVGREALRTGWYMAAIPGMAIFITVFALNAIGNGLSDLFNPRLVKN